MDMNFQYFVQNQIYLYAKSASLVELFCFLILRVWKMSDQIRVKSVK